jgi:hypothetical protein
MKIKKVQISTKIRRPDVYLKFLSNNALFIRKKSEIREL